MLTVAIAVLGLLLAPPLYAGEAASIAERITALYAEHNPSKLDAVPGLMSKYAGHEEELLATVQEKYSAKESSPSSAAPTSALKKSGRKARRAAKARTGKAAARPTGGMMEAAKIGQQLVQAMTGRGRGTSAETLVDEVVAAYTSAAEDPSANQTEAWERMGYYQRGYYQEIEKKLKTPDGKPAGGAATATLRALGRHRLWAFSTYRHLVDAVNPHCMQGWEGLASVRDDMAAVGQASWPDAVATYHEALQHHPTWVRGVRRAAEIILSEHGVADRPGAPYSYTDALTVMDALIDRIVADPEYFSRSCSTNHGGPVQCQFLNLQWIYGSTVALHAERGNLSRALEIEGLACKFTGCDPSGRLRLLNAPEILPHYNVPLVPIPSSEGAHDDDGADVAVFDSALSDDVFSAVQNGFRLSSKYWGREGKDYAADFYSHWYSLKDKPTNAIHQALQQLAMRIPPSERHLIEGVEWWAHKRPYGDPDYSPESVEGHRFLRSYYQHHALHFDLDDAALDETGKWIHPFYGSVLYLTAEGGGPTVIIEQKSDTLAWRENEHANPVKVNGSLVTPQQRAYVRWRGDRLHGVLPPTPPARTAAAGSQKHADPTSLPPPPPPMSVSEQITALYAEHNPEKIDKVSALLRKYEGYEASLLESIMEKYNVKEPPQHPPPPPPPPPPPATRQLSTGADEITERITLTVAYWARRRCITRGDLECADDRVPTRESLSRFWQNEFPLVHASGDQPQWWDPAYNPGAEGTPAPPLQPGRLRPVALEQMWA